jgi:predicted  nucleic acid-binding Zn-ribbon protein
MSNPNHEMTQAVIFNRQLDLDKVEKLKERVEKLRQENEALKLRHEKSEKDTHEFVAYFQREMEKKDDMIASLNDTLMMNETTATATATTTATTTATAATTPHTVCLCVRVPHRSS